MTHTLAQPVCTSAPLLAAYQLHAGYGRSRVIADVNLEVTAGQVVGLVGPNGCGKSTLIKALSGGLTPARGYVALAGTTLTQFSPRQRARRLAVLPQHPLAPPEMTVLQLVQCGRAPYARFCRPYAVADHAAVDAALTSCALEPLLHRRLTELSGGERQRAWIAMALAQQPSVLLLDEPTAALDIGHQLEVMHLLTTLARLRRLAVVIVLHDINLVLRYCSRIIIMGKGQIVADRSILPHQDWSVLEDVFGVQATACPRTDADTGMHLCFTRRATETSCR